MLMMGDLELLQEYVSKKSEEAFATLVSRHINMVYSVAFRYAGNRQHAEEITQAVFIILAKKAAGLGKGTVLSGWLFKTARLTASNYLRAEMKRVRREQEACLESNIHEPETDIWKQIAPLLDDAVADLGEKDRNAIVLRFVEGKNLKEVGLAIGVNEEAAKKRVTRAVEKLRGFFSKRGVALSAAALSGIIASNSVQAAPLGLAASVTTGVAQGAAVTSSTLLVVKGTLKLMAWTKLKIAVGVGVAALMAFEMHEIVVQKRELGSVREQLQQRDKEVQAQKALIEQLRQEQLAMENDLHSATAEKAKIIGSKKSAIASAVAAAKVGANSGSNASSPMSTLAKMMEDPAMKELVRQQALESQKRVYAPLMKELKLTPEEIEKFLQLQSEKTGKDLEVGLAVMRGETSKADGIRARTESKQALDSQLQGLLGDARYAQYEDFTANQPSRNELAMFKGKLDDNNRLSEEQSERMLALIKAEDKQGKLPKPDYENSPELLDKYLEDQAARDRRIQQQAASFLNPEQADILAQSHSNRLNMTRIGMNMKKTLMGGK